jgi:hypothetical protein
MEKSNNKNNPNNTNEQQLFLKTKNKKIWSKNGLDKGRNKEKLHCAICIAESI